LFPPAVQGVELVFEEVKAQLGTFVPVAPGVTPLDPGGSMKETAKFIGDLSWFSASKTRGRYSSPREALKAHLDYILRPEECALSYNLDKAEWLRRAESLLEKNTRSRIAAKQVFALPNDLSPGEGLALLKEFLTSREIFFYKVREDGKTKRVPVRLSEEDLGVAIHDSKSISGVRNLHAHVLFSPIHRGRKLDANKKSLSVLHREWESFLQERGYTLRRSPVREPHYGPSRLRYDRRARASYAHLVRGKQLWRAAVEREQLRRVMEQATRTRGGGNLPTWDEILAEDEKIATRGEREPRSRPSPKPGVKPKSKSVRKRRPKLRPKKPLSHSHSGRQSRSGQQQSSMKPTNEAEREHLKFLRRLEDEVERKRQEEELRQQREAEVLQQFEEQEDDWDYEPSL